MDRGSMATKNSKERPSWGSIWMGLAVVLADRSTCGRLKVGCVVVTEDNTRVLALGYNGNYKYGPNECDDPSTPGKCGCLHAEDNALLKMDFTDPARKVMYVTHLPCIMCAKRIINARIHHVIYLHSYRDESSIALLAPRISKLEG